MMTHATMTPEVSTSPCQRLSRPVTLLSLIALLCAAPLAAQKVIKDTLVKRSGERLRAVEVLDLGSETISYRKAGSESTMPAIQLSHVEWTEPPDAYDLARAALDKGESEAAANYFQEASGKAGEAGRKALELECKFLAARALALGMGREAARGTAAQTALQAYLDAAPSGFRVPEARLLKARALRVAGDAAGAEAALKAFEEDALKQSWGLIWDARAKLERAQLLLEMNKAAEARSAFQGVKSAVDAALGSATGNDALELDSLKMLAVVSEGETYLQEKKLDDAKRYFASLASTSTANPVKAAALAGEAHATVLATAGKADVRALRDAQQKLAQAIVLDSANADTTAKALYLQGQILTTLGPDHEADSYKQRAHDYFETVVKYYGSSPWANEARAALQK
ncbi:MAG: hypothetical protein R3F56_02380 [Planctomycetota bacterium]